MGHVYACMCLAADADDMQPCMHDEPSWQAHGDPLGGGMCTGALPGEPSVELRIGWTLESGLVGRADGGLGEGISSDAMRGGGLCLPSGSDSGKVGCAPVASCMSCMARRISDKLPW